MDRHARAGEDAKMAQERLYRESFGLPPRRRCVRCGRVGTRQFVQAPFRTTGFCCRAVRACRRRMVTYGLTGR